MGNNGQHASTEEEQDTQREAGKITGCSQVSG